MARQNAGTHVNTVHCRHGSGYRFVRNGLARRSTDCRQAAGAGAHPARAVALLRALTEAIQVRTTYITGARDDLRPDEFTPAAIERKLRRAQLLMSERGVARAFGEVPTYEAATLALDLVWMLERLQAVGIEEVITVDLTRSVIGMPVARVVIPGLEAPHDHDGYVAGPRALKVSGERR